MEIREATPADAAGIARVQVETWRSAYAGLVADTVLDRLSVPAGTGRWAHHVQEPGQRVWVADGPGGVAGFVCAGPSRDLDAPGGEVYALYVLPADQRGGCGRALLAAATGWLVTQGHDEVALWVLTANAAARAFYERLGWRWDGTERDIDVLGDVVGEVRYRMTFRG